MVGRSGTIVDHIDAVEGNAIPVRDVAGTEGAHRGEADGPLGRLGEPAPVMPGHPIGQPLRMVLEVQVVLHRDLRHLGPGAQKTVRRQEEVCTDAPQPPGKTPVHPPIHQEGPPGRGPHPVAIDILPREQSRGGSPVKEEVEFVLRMCGHDALHGLEREPADAIEPPRDDQTGVDGDDGHGGETTLHRAMVERTHILRCTPWAFRPRPGASCACLQTPVPPRT